MVDVLNKIQPAQEHSEDGTAIGEAVALGVERLRDAMKNAPIEKGRQPIQSAAIILLTDGENNAGDIDPRVAADLAATYGIKIYAIGVGTRGNAPFPVGTDPFGQQIMRNVPVTIDEVLLKDLAKRTGGEYFRATDTSTLKAIYDQIDKLEKQRPNNDNRCITPTLLFSHFDLQVMDFPTPRRSLVAVVRRTSFGNDPFSQRELRTLWKSNTTIFQH